MRTLIFGAGGGLGGALASALPRLGFGPIELVAGRAACDLRDAGAVGGVLRAAKPQIVFNAAAFTNVDAAENEPDLAFASNAEGAENAARACADTGARFVHYSTDFVFDGTLDDDYDESAVPTPQSAYARSKVEGDRRVLLAHPDALLLRVGCLYGHGGRNFASTLARRLRAGEVLRCDDERLASPTWNVRAAEISGQLARAGHKGLFHVTAHGSTTWAAFARLVAKGLAVPDDRVVAVTGQTLALAALRPRRAILAKRRLAEVGLDTIGDWRSHLRAYLATEGAVTPPSVPPTSPTSPS